MARIIADRESILELLKPQRGGSVNAWQQEFAYLSAHNLFVEESDFTGGRSALAELVRRAGGPMPSNAETRFSIIETIDNDRFDILGFVALQTELIGSGLYIELIDWPAFLRLSDVAYQTDVPTFVPNYQTPVIDPVTGDQTGWTRLAWSEWKNENQTHLTSDVTGDGFNYIPLWSGNNGNHLALSVLKQIVDAGGFVRGMKDWPEVEGGE
jgi:hypothetical protein